MDNDIIAAKIGKYQNALSNLCGVEYAYMQGDPGVDAIVELIDIYVQQMRLIDEQNAEIKVKKKLLDIAEAKFETLEMDKKQLESDIFNTNMNLEHLQKLYEERATLCEEQDRQIFELETEVDRLRNNAAVLPQNITAVVRCKDCKWYGKATCAMDDPYSVSDNNFCSFGTRKVVLANDTKWKL